VVATIVSLTVFLIALVVVMVMVAMRRPRGKGIGEISPVLFALLHLPISQETRIKFALENTGIEIQSHDREGLAPIAERFLPFFPRSFRYCRIVRSGVTRCPPFPSGRALDFTPGQIQSAHFIHAAGEPEETLGAKYTGEVVLEQVPKTVGMKRASPRVMKGGDWSVARCG
jgi:hypothetical protein